MKITIPKNDSEARQVAEQHNLTGWALAGYVASQVTLEFAQGDNRHTRQEAKSSLLTCREFAAKGFRGLRSKDTVRLYAERWRDHVGEPPRPGQVMNLPDLDWPPVPTGIGRSHSGASRERSEAIQRQAAKDGVGASKAVDIASNPKAMAAAIKADPATAEAAATALAEARGLAVEAGDAERTVRRMQNEQEAWDDNANRSDTKGGEFENKAMFYIQQLHDYGHDHRIPAVIEFARGLLDLASAQDLTPEMFHE